MEITEFLVDLTCFGGAFKKHDSVRLQFDEDSISAVDRDTLRILETFRCSDFYYQTVKVLGGEIKSIALKFRKDLKDYYEEMTIQFFFDIGDRCEYVALRIKAMFEKNIHSMVCDKDRKRTPSRRRYVPPLLPEKPETLAMYLEGEDKKDKKKTNKWIFGTPNKVKHPLENVGNSCYMNATMQALSSCPAVVTRAIRLLRHISRHPFRKESRHPDGWLIQYSFRDILRMIVCLNKGFEEVLSLTKDELRDIRQRFGMVRPDFANEDQQDAHEFLTSVISLIDETLEMSGKIDDVDIGPDKGIDEIQYGKSLIALNPTYPLQMELEKSFKCPRCHHVDFKKENSKMLNIAVHAGYTIEEMLASYFRSAKIEKTCSKCDNNSSIVSEKITDFPQTLVLNLKRYELIGREYKRKEGEIKVPFEFDASAIGQFSSTTKLEEDVLDDDRSSNEWNGSSRESSRIPVLGGAADDICIVSISDKPLVYKWFSNKEEIVKTLENMRIEPNKDQFENHVKRLGDQGECTMERDEVPDGLVDIEADGNCFFRAVSWCLSGSQRNYRKVRSATVDFMLKNEKILGGYCATEDYQEHCENMADDAEWATTCEIFAVANMLNVTVYTFLRDKWIAHLPKNAKETPNGGLYLCNLNEHFEPVYNFRSQTGRARRTGSRKRKAADGDDDNDSKDEESSTRKSSRSFNEATEIRYQPMRGCKGPSEGVKKKVMPSTSDESIKYSLVAAVCHFGECAQRGHFSTYCKDSMSDLWNICNDELVMEIEVDRAAATISKDAYILFYDRV